MDGDPRAELTQTLEALRSGDPSAEARLGELLWRELQRRAAQLMNLERRLRPEHTLETRALFNETWLRLKAGDSLQRMKDGMGLVQAASQVMREVLIDHARARNAQKRLGGRKRVPLDAVIDHLEAKGWDLLALNEAIEELAKTRSDLVSQIIWLRYVEEYEVKEVAEMLGVTIYRVERASALGLAFLRGRLGGTGS